VADILIVILKIYIYIFIFSLDLLQKFGRQQLDQFAEFRFRGLRQSTNPVSIYRQEASSLPCSIVLRRVVETAAGGPRKGLFLSGDVISRFAPIPIVTLLTTSY
jgi:hypothetical protein